MKPVVVLATRNPGKVKEFRYALRRCPVRLKSLQDFKGVPQVAETGRTLEANALKKAAVVARWTGLPAVPDDTALEVKALGGKPGLHSARYAGPRCRPADNMAKLLKAMRRFKGLQRRATFRCVIAFVQPGVPPTLIEGRCAGRITDTPKGQGGFGYDPVFQPRGSSKTFAQMSLSQKHRVSHRGRALRRFSAFLAVKS